MKVKYELINGTANVYGDLRDPLAFYFEGITLKKKVKTQYGVEFPCERLFRSYDTEQEALEALDKNFTKYLQNAGWGAVIEIFHEYFVDRVEYDEEGNKVKSERIAKSKLRPYYEECWNDLKEEGKLYPYHEYNEEW